jgi:hypothetical protein
MKDILVCWTCEELFYTNTDKINREGFKKHKLKGHEVQVIPDGALLEAGR